MMATTGFPETSIRKGVYVTNIHGNLFEILGISTAYDGCERVVVISPVSPNKQEKLEHVPIREFCGISSEMTDPKPRFKLYEL